MPSALLAWFRRCLGWSRPEAEPPTNAPNAPTNAPCVTFPEVDVELDLALDDATCDDPNRATSGVRPRAEAVDRIEQGEPGEPGSAAERADRSDTRRHLAVDEIVATRAADLAATRRIAVDEYQAVIEERARRRRAS